MTNGALPFEMRVAAARELLERREQAASHGWRPEEWRERARRLVLSSTDRGDLEVMVEALTLVGREWLRASPSPPEAEVAVYGDRTFVPILAPGRCQSGRLWGYTCPFVEGAPSYDHLFPAALGGPTEASNLLVLCERHNLMKSMDVHVFPWEEGLPSWVDRVLQSLERWMFA
jgi:hypothetical protein